MAKDKASSKSAKSRKGALRSPSTLVIVFVILWLAFTLYASTFIANPSTALVDPNKNNDAGAVQRNVEAKVDNPWEGWQPDIDNSEETSCNVRMCFKDEKGKQKVFLLEQCPRTCAIGPLGDPPDVAADWIPDVEVLHRMFQAGKDANGNPWPPPLSKEFCEPMGFSGGKNSDPNKALLDAVPISIVEKEDSASTTRILCMVYTMSDAHAERIRAIRETWAGRCDGFLAFSTVSDPRLPAISLPHDGPEEYNNMWQKVRSIWRFGKRKNISMALSYGTPSHSLID